MRSRTTHHALFLALAAGLAASASADFPIGWCGTTPAARPQPQVAPRAVDTPRVEVVFVLDTTGSMSGLIEGAKQTIWSIANAIATGEPHPDVHMGLVGYRDRGDDYVTTITPLTDDLDAVYSTLMGFDAAGGGDGPESVNQALHDALSHISWSDDRDTLRLIYLVGDAEPHMDYDQDVPYSESARLAAERGIIINTIQCGSSHATADVWQQIARAAEGEYFAIAQDGGVDVIATPFDAELSDLGAQLGQTVVGYGDLDEQHEQQARQDRAATLSAGAPAPAAAERAIYNSSESGRSNLQGRKELVDAVQSGQVRLEDLPADQLPENMRDMSQDERVAYIQQQAASRSQIQARISELGVQRREFIEQQRAQVAADGGFDQKVVDTLRRQAERFGIVYKQPKPTGG